MSMSEEFRSVKDEAKEILASELPERCQNCPTRGIEAGALAVAVAFRYDHVPREETDGLAHKLAENVRTECTLGPSVGGGDFYPSHCNLGVRH